MDEVLLMKFYGQNFMYEKLNFHGKENMKFLQVLYIQNQIDMG
jgi:hypothetical protein